MLMAEKCGFFPVGSLLLVLYTTWPFEVTFEDAWHLMIQKVYCHPTPWVTDLFQGPMLLSYLY